MYVRLLDKLRGGAFEHIHGDPGDRAEAAALDEDALLVEHVGRLDHFAVCHEHCGFGQPLLHELQRHETVVHVGERGAGELEHVHFDAVGREIVEKRVDQGVRIVMLINRPIDEIHPDNAERFLLLHVFFVEKPHMDDDLRRRTLRHSLELDAEPAVRLILALVAAGGHSVREGEKPGGRPALFIQPLHQQGELAVEHRLKALPADVTFTRAVDRIADRHVIGRHRLLDGARRAAHAEKPAR